MLREAKSALTPELELKRRLSKPALNLTQFTVEKHEQRERANETEKLLRDDLFIVDLSRPPKSQRNVCRLKDTKDLAADYSHQPIESVAAAAIESLISW